MTEFDDKKIIIILKLCSIVVQCPTPQSYEIAEYRVMNSSAEVSTLLYDYVIAFECDWNRGFEATENQTSKFAYWRCNENSTWDKQNLKCAKSGLLKQLGAHSNEETTHESTSAVVTGTLVLSICGFFFAIVICLDYMTISRDMRRLKHNISHMLKRFRDQNRVKQLHDIRTLIRAKVARENVLQRAEANREAHQLAAAGIGQANSDVLVANPLSKGDRPTTAMFKSHREQHIEADGMDLPSDPALREPDNENL